MPTESSRSVRRRTVWRRRVFTVAKLCAFGMLMLLPSGSSLAQGSLLPPGAVAAGTAATPRRAVRVRRNIEELFQPSNAAELNNLRHAFEVLIQRSLNNPDDPRGYIHYANLHNDDSVGPCDHVNDVFQGWHRAHLIEFEKALQDSDPDNPTTPTRDVMLPYWDWTTKPSGSDGYPKIFEEETTADGRPNIFHWPNKALCDKLTNKFCDQRNSHPGDAPPYPVKVVNTILSDPWARFGGTKAGAGSLETRPHNFMHGAYVGSDMGDNTTAAYDPIFWFFHTNIDRVMEAWQELHQPDRCEANPDQNIMPNLDAAVRGTGNWPSTGTLRDFLCVEKLGYRYDSVPTPIPTPLSSMAAAAVATRPQDSVAPSGVSVSLKFKIPAGVTRERVYLELPGISTPPRGAYEVRVYLHPQAAKYRPNDRAFADRYFAGSLVIWAIRHQTRGKVMEHQMTSDYSLNITEKFNEIAPSNAGKNWVATIVTTSVGNAPKVGLLGAKTKAPAGASAMTAPSITVEGTAARRRIDLVQR